MTSRVNRDRITFNGSSPRATELPDFVTCDDPWFRPVDNQLGPDGAFYIADFYNRIIGHYEVPLQHPGRDRERGRIWRVVYRGPGGAARLRPIALTNDLDGLIRELGSPNISRRMLAMNAIADRFGAAAIGALTKAATEPTNPLQLVHALWLLHRFGNLAPQQLNSAAQSDSPFVRVHSQRIAVDLLGQTSKQTGATEAALSVANRGLLDPDALVQRCAAEALGEFPRVESVRPLLELRRRVPVNDPHLLYVVRKSIRNILANDAVFETILSRSDWSSEDLRTVADVAIAVNSPLAGTFLIRQIPNLDIDRDALAVSLQHAARYAPPGELDSIARIAQRRFGTDDGFQLTLFKSAQEGFQQRGVELSPAVRTWGGSLCSNILASAAQSEWWNTPKSGVADTANPWAFQERPSADGVSAMLLSSHPLGEQLTGALRSRTFIAPNALIFYLAGHDGYPDKPAQKQNVVRLHDAHTDAVLREASPPRNDTAQKIGWDLSDVAGKSVYLEATDGDTAGAYAWLAFGRFDPPVITLPTMPPGQWSLRQQDAAELVAKLQLGSFKPRLKELASANATDIEVRVAAARALGALAPGEALPILSALIADTSLPASARVKACESLVEQNSNESRAVVLKTMQTAPGRLQLRFGQTLAGNAAGAEALLTASEAGQLPPQLLADRSLKQKLLAAAPANAEARVTRLTRNLPAANAEVQRLIDQRKASFESGRFVAASGEPVFTKNCRVCHQIDGTGSLVGPQLDGVGGRGLERLLEDMLDPNRNVDPAFHTINVVLHDGDVVSGLFRREEGEAIVLADSTGKEISIPKKDITERRASTTSLMPENFGEIVTGEDFNNLMAFLLAHGPKAAAGK
jgi:putative heme-binding domain-containing protein